MFDQTIPSSAVHGSGRSIYVPYPVFDIAINLLIRESGLKQMIARLKKNLIDGTPEALVPSSEPLSTIQIGNQTQ
jgi:hypothetical protein